MSLARYISKFASLLNSSGQLLTAGHADASITAAKLAAGAARANFGAGAVLQVVQTVKTNTQYITGARVWQDVAGMSVSITPTSASSKILVIVTMHASGDGSYDTVFKVQRNGADIISGDANGGRICGMFSGGMRGTYEGNLCGIHYLDSPATTSSITYKIQNNPQSGTMINCDKYNTSDSSSEGYISTITVMEIAG